MKRYKNFNIIDKKDISVFRGLEEEVTFTPRTEVEIIPLRISKFGITYPNKDYYIKREPSPCFIIEYVVSGYGYLEINNEKYKLEPGDAYFIHPGDFCSYYADKDYPYKKYWVNFACDFFFTELLKAYDINDRVIRKIDLSDFFEELFKFEGIYISNDDLCIPASKLILNVLMDIALHKKNDIINTNHKIAQNIRFILNKSVTTKISIDDIAKKLYRSKNDIIRQFKKKYNVTPYNYLIDLRIDRSKNMLVNTQKTISEISSYLCFSSEYHFSNTFKQKVGVSPSEFRKINRE